MVLSTPSQQGTGVPSLKQHPTSRLAFAFLFNPFQQGSTHLGVNFNGDPLVDCNSQVITTSHFETPPTELKTIKQQSEPIRCSSSSRFQDLCFAICWVPFTGEQSCIRHHWPSYQGAMTQTARTWEPWLSGGSSLLTGNNPYKQDGCLNPAHLGVTMCDPHGTSYVDSCPGHRWSFGQLDGPGSEKKPI